MKRRDLLCILIETHYYCRAIKIKKRPWYPPSPYYEIPELPPLTRKTFSEFEQKLRKVLPKNRVKTGDPMARYGHFREIGTG